VTASANTTPDTAPAVSVVNVTATHGQSFAAANLFAAHDVENNPLTRFGFWNSGTGGGHFMVDGVALPVAQEIDEPVYVCTQLRDDELHALRHQARDKMDISAEAVQLCDHDGASAATRFCEGSSKLRASVEGIGAFAGLDLDELACDLEPLGGSEAHHCSRCASRPRPERPWRAVETR
jgi:hypothetical protein